MKLLLDTHIVLWLITDDGRLSKKARELIADERNICYFSATSSWEVSIKHEKRPDLMQMSGLEFAEAARSSNLEELAVTVAHTCHELDKLPEHKDPFDRILLAQVAYEGMRLVTHDHLLATLDGKLVVAV